LDLSCCDLEDVPVKEIAAVKKGTHLDLSNNQLVRLPSTFVTLTHIVKLDLSKNLLEELPENIGQLRQLKHLDLYSNKISRLPLSFGELRNLKWLDLKDNPLNSVLSHLAGPCSNKEQCQDCATLVINYYAEVIEAVEKKKELAIKTAAEEEQKREMKKKKKKKKNAAKENHEEKEKVVLPESESEQFVENAYQEVAEEISPKAGLCSTLCHKLFALLVWLIVLALIFVLVVAIIPKIDTASSDRLVNYMEAQTGLPVKNYQLEGTKKLDSLIDYAGILMNRTRILIMDTYLRHFGEEETVDADDADL